MNKKIRGIFNKKGISPLIATVLILGFTVALAAVIMTWGQSFTRQIQESTTQQTNVQLTCATDVIYDISNACYINDTALKLTVKNDANKQIEKFQVRIFRTASDVETTTIDKSLGAFSIDTPEVITTGNATLTKQIELIPIVDISGQTVTCSANIDAFGDTDGSVLLPC